MVESRVLYLDNKNWDRMSKILENVIFAVKKNIKQTFFLFVVKICMEFLYRRLGGNELFRNKMEQIFLNLFEKFKSQRKNKTEEELKKLFAENFPKFCFTEKVRIMILEDLEEALFSYALKKELNQNKEQVVYILQKAFNECKSL